MARSRVSWRVVLAGAAAYSLFAALVSFWFTRATGLSLWSLEADRSANFAYILAMNVVLWGSWAMFAPAVFELGRRFRFDRHGWQRALLVHVPAAALVTSLHIVVVATGRFLLQRLWGIDAGWQAGVYDAFFRTLDFELPVYWALVGLQHALDYYGEVRAREVAAAHLEARLIEAQLQALQRQLHPHFLFNTLHAISALVHREPDKADAMIERLSDLLRLTLDKVGVQEVTLDQELDYLRAYLDIEQVHFGDRLEVFYDVDAHVMDALVPNLILQPLAENAIRHGLEPRSARGRLAIEAFREGDALVLRVTDTGRGLFRVPAVAPREGMGPAEAGVGLSNTRARLSRLYGSAARLDLQPNAGGGAVATVCIPFKTSEAPPETGEKNGGDCGSASLVAALSYPASGGARRLEGRTRHQIHL